MSLWVMSAIYNGDTGRCGTLQGNFCRVLRSFNRKAASMLALGFPVEWVVVSRQSVSHRQSSLCMTRKGRIERNGPPGAAVSRAWHTPRLRDILPAWVRHFLIGTLGRKRYISLINTVSYRSSTI